MIPIPTGVVKWFRTGSSYVCDPPVNNTDYDIVAYVLPENFEAFIKGMLEEDWKLGGSRPALEEWVSFKKKYTDGTLYNIITTKDDNRYDMMERATALAKHFNLLKKEDRIILFHAVVDGILPLFPEGEKLPFL